MAATPEKKVKQRVVAQLKALGAYYFYPVTGGFGTGGLFDIVACYKGWFIGIECKADYKNRGPTELQNLNAMKAKSSGGIVLLLDQHNTHLLTEVLHQLEMVNDESTEPNELCFWPTDRH